MANPGAVVPTEVGKLAMPNTVLLLFGLLPLDPTRFTFSISPFSIHPQCSGFRVYN